MRALRSAAQQTTEAASGNRRRTNVALKRRFLDGTMCQSGRASTLFVAPCIPPVLSYSSLTHLLVQGGAHDESRVVGVGWCLWCLCFLRHGGGALLSRLRLCGTPHAVMARERLRTVPTCGQLTDGPPPGSAPCPGWWLRYGRYGRGGGGASAERCRPRHATV